MWAYAEDEAHWFRRGLGLNCTCTADPYWEENFQWSWAYLFRPEDTTRSSYNFLVEGPNVFVKIILNFIGKLNVRSSVNKVIVICSERIQEEFGIPGF